MNNQKKNIGNKIFFAIGIAVGLCHLYLGTMSIFLFKEREPIISWIMIASGPLVTLPAIILGIRYPRASAVSLFCGASLAALLMAISEGLRGEHVLSFAIYISLPMYALACVSLMTNKQRKS